MPDLSRTRAHAPAFAFLICALGIAFFSAMDAVMKGLTLAIGVYNVLLWRSLTGVAISLGLAASQTFPRPSRSNVRIHLLRGGVSVLMALLFFWGLARVPIAQAVALTFIAPPLSLFLAAIILKERVGRRAVVGSIIGVGGVAVILSGQARAEYGTEALAGTIAVIASAVCYAYNIVLMRQQASVARPIEILLFQNTTVTLYLLCGAPWFATIPPIDHGMMILLAAALATLSQLLMGWAYARAPASYLAPTEFTAFIWAALFGWIFFSETLAGMTILGAALIIGACLLAAGSKPEPFAASEGAI